MPTKTCGSCGESFECAAPARSCWCEQIQLDAATLGSLRARFADCLCQRCIAKFANAGASGAVSECEA